MKLQLRPFIILLTGLILMLSGCSVTRNFETNEFLLTKNQIHISGGKILPEELEPYIEQQPNSKFLGLFRPNIALYNWGKRGDDSKFKTWLRTKAGTAPVLLDTSLVASSLKKMGLYLSNRGYFQSILADTIKFRKQKAKVRYLVSLSQPYRIRNLTYSIPDTQVASVVLRDTAQSLIKRGNNYDVYLLDDERTRITQLLLSKGFFRFSSNYIKYIIDTNLRSKQLDMTLEIINEVVPSFDELGAWKMVRHKRYMVGKVFVYPSFDHLKQFTGRYDTITKTYRTSSKSNTSNIYNFLTIEGFPVRPRTLAQAIFVTPGTLYNLDDVNQSYAQLANLQVFKYIKLQFRDPVGQKKSTQPGTDLVDCHIELSPKAAQSFAATTDGTNSSGAFGVQGNLGYTHSNIFRGAQMLRLNLSGSLQMQASDGFETNKLFNTIELGVNASLSLPQFLIPFKQEQLHRRFKPRTVINLGYNYQLQEHYNRHISNVSFGYTWRQNDKISHLINPIEYSLVKIFKDAYFDSVINSQNDNRLKYQYTDHLIAGLKYSFTFNNQQVGKSRNFVYIRSNFETSGNLIYLANMALYGPKDEGTTYKLFGQPFAQFVRPDLDLRIYEVFRNKSSLVYRFYGGIGIPYGNTPDLPFEKAFFAGGANGMRGWKMYALGPGTYKNTDPNQNFNQIGDIQLEANIEYRFPVYDWIKSGLYIDIGNIWLLQESPDLPGGKFEFSNFLGELAIDAGLGIRFDFDFFIFRFDPAIPLKVPSLPAGQRWTFSHMQLKDIIWNFGIGYPF